MSKKFLVSFVFLIFLIGFVSAGTYSSSTYQYRGSGVSYDRSDYSTYWPVLADSPETCEARTDVLLQVSPAGCTPNVVRSDLLAEQNVPVFCQIDALEINPLIDVERIENIRFKGDYPSSVVSTGFHPARAALRSDGNVLGSPTVNNIGYVVVVLKRNEVEDNLPESVNVNLSAQLEYSSRNVLGVGNAEFLLKEIDDDSVWDAEKDRYSFWQGRYFVRLLEADSERARVALYSGDRIIATEVVRVGEESGIVYFPGFYCQAGLRVAYDGFEQDADKVLLAIGEGDGVDRVIVTEGSKFLDNKCSVRNIDIGENGEDARVSVSCGSQRLTLDVKRTEKIFEFSVGNEVYASGKKGNYVGENDAKYVVAFEDGTEESFERNQVIPYIPLDSANSELGVFEGALEDRDLGTLQSDADEALMDYEDVAIDYPAEEISEDIKVGEESLYKAIGYALRWGQYERALELMETYDQIYPDGRYSESFRSQLIDLASYDYSGSIGVVQLANKFYTIDLVKAIPLADDSKSAVNLEVNGLRRELTVGETLEFSEETSVGELKSITIGRIRDSDSVTLNAVCEDGDGDIRRDSATFGLNEVIDLCVSDVRVTSIDSNEIAKVRLVSEGRGTGSEVNLSVNIGIEKRAIDLSPARTSKMIDNLNESIEKWSSISDRLSGSVEGLKAACFATSAVLTAKNFLGGFSGEGIARQRVMRGPGGWTEFCETEVENGNYVSLDACYLENSDEIGREVDAAESVINRVNDNIDRFEVKSGSGGLFSGEDIDEIKTRVAYCNYLRDRYDLNYLQCTEDYVPTYGNLREIEFNEEIKLEVPSGRISQNADDTLGDIKNSIEAEVEAIQENKEAIGQGKGVRLTLSPNPQGTTERADIKSVSGNEEFSGFNNGEDAYAKVRVHSTVSLDNGAGVATGFTAGNYVVGLKKSTDGNVYIPVGIYTESSELVEIEDKITEFVREYGVSQFVPAVPESYSNGYSNPSVQYFEREPYKGLPAVVPFDTNRGWYAATKQTISGVFGEGSGPAYEESGRVSTFWICNVGPDGRESFNSASKDDLCTLINRNSFDRTSLIAGFTESQSRDLYNRAIRAIEEASNQYGNRLVRIEGEDFDSAEAISVPATQCQDFMSPEDCNLMFNVCDPVICPNSRCDLGGAYPVADVVQTGIVGSALLCLPNIREGIAIPVCLTGINAGIEGYVSILESHRDCLQENLETGRTVGICDEIYSVYMCEFFWRQVAPVAELLLPSLVESAYGQGTRGGGEYLTVMSAWDNLQGSVNYFTQNYATNSLKAFRARNVEEAGGEFCQGFISAGIPTDFDSLIEPDSPTQFHAWFDSYPFNDVTVPATDQYKVFYHIFAGNDAGVQYSVYLKGAPESNVFSIPATVQVDTGFIKRGDKVTETQDFTAPSGYQELCVRINNEEECGFGRVSTSFAVNYLSDSYVSSEIDRRAITGESECISGGVNLGAFVANPNIQSGAEEAFTPEIVEQGIVRICASSNPGSAEDPSRFVEVGICDDAATKCWLDRDSVDRAISSNNVGLRNETLTNIQEDSLAQLQGAGFVIGDSDAERSINLIREDIASLGANPEDAEVSRILGEIAYLENRIVDNRQKAVLALVGAGLKSKVVDAKCVLSEVCRDKAVKETVTASDSEGNTGDSDNGESTNSGDSASKINLDNADKIGNVEVLLIGGDVENVVQEVPVGSRFRLSIEDRGCIRISATAYNDEREMARSEGDLLYSYPWIARGSSGSEVPVKVSCFDFSNAEIESKLIGVRLI